MTYCPSGQEPRKPGLNRITSATVTSVMVSIGQADDIHTGFGGNGLRRMLTYSIQYMLTCLCLCFLSKRPPKSTEMESSKEIPFKHQPFRDKENALPPRNHIQTGSLGARTDAHGRRCLIASAWCKTVVPTTRHAGKKKNLATSGRYPIDSRFGCLGTSTSVVGFLQVVGPERQLIPKRGRCPGLPFWRCAINLGGLFFNPQPDW